jgi:hypothetical protein
MLIRDFIDAKVLLAYLLFEPGLCVRVPIRLPLRREYVVLCSHGEVPHFDVARIAKEVTGGNFDRVAIAWSEYVLPEAGGDVWRGRCKCGKVFYGVQPRVQPRKPKTPVKVEISQPNDRYAVGR